MFTRTVARALSRFGLDQRRADPHSRKPAPMLLQNADALFSSLDWTYEPKWDGSRVLASIRDGSVRGGS
jgi:ATP-dependent DNA ligase